MMTIPEQLHNLVNQLKDWEINPKEFLDRAHRLLDITVYRDEKDGYD